MVSDGNETLGFYNKLQFYGRRYIHNEGYMGYCIFGVFLFLIASVLFRCGNNSSAYSKSDYDRVKQEVIDANNRYYGN